MEQNKRKYNLRPLPGGRRGAPGAGAGCFSLRDTGDEELSRRALVTQYATAGRRELSRRAHGVDATAESSGDDTLSLFSSIPSTRPSYMTRRTSTLSSSSTLADVVQEVNPDLELVPTPSATCTRRRWTPKMNKFILRTYLQLTALDTDTKTYLEPLHLKFIEKYPDMQVSRQRVGDQRRAIVRNKLLPQSTIDKIYSDVKEELSNLERSLSTQQMHTITHTPVRETHQTLTPTAHTLQTSIKTGNSLNLTRMRWTTEHNEAIMLSYYKITQLDTNRTTYRKPLHEAFISIFPSLAHLSEQRIADQRRAIVNNKYINDDRLNIIKQQVAEELSVNTNHPNNVTDEIHITQETNSENTQVQFLNSIELGLPEDPLPEQQSTRRDTHIDETFNQTFQHFKNSDPTTRPYIPKQKTSKKSATIVNYLNKVILPENVNLETDFNTLQTVIYSAAWTAAKINGAKVTLELADRSLSAQKENKPHWQRRLERRLEHLRTNIGRLTQFINGNRSRNLDKQVEGIIEQYKIHSVHEEPNTQLTHTLDTLKQKLAVVTGRLRRYKACTLRKQQNNQFKNNESQFYRNLRQTTTNTQENSNTDNSDNVPDPEDLQMFWAGIWEQPVNHNAHAEWIQTEIENHNTTTQMKFEHIPIDTFQKVLRNLHNWKAPGSDNIHSYWYKKFTSIHGHLHNHLNKFIEDPSIIPPYIFFGTTFMIPKDRNDRSDPAKYRPITCLQTLYKILTSCISELIYKHVDDNNILAEQQKGCRKFSQGCKEQLIIDSVILKQVQKLKSDLFSMYIDYKKAYDSVPHSWLIQVLEIYKIHPKIVTFLKTTMINWMTKLKLSTPTKTIETEPIRIQRGIFQGDALSPLWFCLALNPLSNILNSSTVGYLLKYSDNDRQTERRQNINHLLYMDDIKLYADNEDHLYQLANLTERFTCDIKMEFGTDKCKINSIRAGQNYKHNYTLETGEQIEPLDEQETYKYLGYNQSLQICYRETKEKLKQVFRHRLNSIMKTQLYARNTFKAINTYAIPVLTYSFGIINWTKSDLKTLQRSINTTLTKFRKHHPRSCLQRLTLPRKEGGRGLIDITNLHNRQIITLRQYFFSKSESSVLHKAIVHNDHKATPLNLQDMTSQNNQKLTDDKTKLAEWAGKSLHGRHRHDLCQPNVDKDASNAWLSHGGLFPETEGFIMAIQDQVIETKNYQKYITKTRTSDTCRKCNSCPETIQHITGACKSIAQTDYKHRHDQVANVIHQKLAHQQKLITSIQPYYKYSPQSVLENSTTKLYFDRAILTDRTIHYNRPDITLINKTNKTGYLIDIAVPNTHNLQSTITEKLTKYVELKDEITRIWHLQKVTIVPIVLSSTGVIPKQLHQSLKTLDLPPYTYHLLQKAVILNTCRLVRKFLQNEQDQMPLPQTATLTRSTQITSNPISQPITESITQPTSETPAQPAAQINTHTTMRPNPQNLPNSCSDMHLA